MDWRREAAEAGGWAVGSVAVSIAGPVWRPNMASMVERSAALRGVERVSAGRSNYVNVCLVKETGKNGKRNAPLIHAGIDPPVRNPTQSFVKSCSWRISGRVEGMRLRTWRALLKARLREHLRLVEGMHLKALRGALEGTFEAH